MGTLLSKQDDTLHKMAFVLDGADVKARFSRNDARVNGVTVPQDVSLADPLHVGTRASVYYVKNLRESEDAIVQYRAHVDVTDTVSADEQDFPPTTLATNPPSSSTSEISNKTLSYRGVIVSLSARSGVASFRFDERQPRTEDRVRFTRANTRVGRLLVPQYKPLKETLAVGVEVTLTDVEPHKEHDETVRYKGHATVAMKGCETTRMTPDEFKRGVGGLEKKEEPSLRMLGTSEVIDGTVVWVSKTLVNVGVAMFLNNGSGQRASFCASSFTVDKKLWSTLFLSQVLQTGVNISLTHFVKCDDDFCSYSADGSVDIDYHELEKLSMKVLRPVGNALGLTGKIVHTIKNKHGKNVPLFVSAVVGKTVERVFIKEMHIIINGIYVDDYTYLLPDYYFSLGSSVVLTNIESLDDKRAHNVHTLCKYTADIEVYDPEMSLVNLLKKPALSTAPHFPPTAPATNIPSSSTTGRCDKNLSYHGVIVSLTTMSGIASFRLDERQPCTEEKVRFTRDNVFVGGLLVTQNNTLNKTLSVGAEVTLSEVEPHKEFDETVRYKGRVNVVVKDAETPKMQPDEDDEGTLEEKEEPEMRVLGTCDVVKGTIVSVSGTFVGIGVAQYLNNGRRQMASFHISSFTVDNEPRSVAFLSQVLQVGMDVSLTRFLKCTDDHCSYVADGIIEINLPELKRLSVKTQRPIVNASVETGEVRGEIVQTLNTGNGINTPLVVSAVINDSIERVFIKQKNTKVNGIHVEDYLYLLPEDYFSVGSHVFLTNIELFNNKKPSYKVNTLCTYTADVEVNNPDMTLVNLLGNLAERDCNDDQSSSSHLSSTDESKEIQSEPNFTSVASTNHECTVLTARCSSVALSDALLSTADGCIASGPDVRDCVRAAEVRDRDVNCEGEAASAVSDCEWLWEELTRAYEEECCTVENLNRLKRKQTEVKDSKPQTNTLLNQNECLESSTLMSTSLPVKTDDVVIDEIYNHPK